MSARSAGGVAAAGAEVLLQVDAAEVEMIDPRFGGDRQRVRNTLRAFDRADQWDAGRSVGHPPHIVDRLDLGDSDAVREFCDGVEIGCVVEGSAGRSDCGGCRHSRRDLGSDRRSRPARPPTHLRRSDPSNLTPGRPHRIGTRRNHGPGNRARDAYRDVVAFARALTS
ncbi:hypothetical protein Pd630_LPD14018 (plasmid) [Rhodococcus opacus PD630]|nr:hypothetical protein Pd630_LPD14018 [Rhodococcus opacus PD630]